MGTVPTFGSWLRQRRNELGLTQDEFSERVGFSPALLRKLESGERRPSGQIAYLLADFLHIPADEREAFVVFSRTGDSATSTSATGYSASAPWRLSYLHKTNLPVLLTPLLGREKEVADLTALLTESNAHLVTLTGPPGIGKTRLALQVGAEAIQLFDDGVYLVELAPVTEPEEVLPAIARTLGLPESAEGGVEASLLQHVRDKKLLLLLDNFEQVLDASVDILRLVQGSPWLKVLVTSREALHVRVERRYPVPPLMVPAREQLEDASRATQYPAVRLFAERAQSVDPDFRLDRGNIAAVVEICRRLGGLPLAIELVAARMAMFSPEETLSRLDDVGHLELLTSGARDMPPRHRTLRGAIAWSYNLLNEEERILFRRLGVFVGSFTLEAAIAVTTSGPEPGAAGVVESLLDKSMVTREERPRDPDASQRPYSGGRLGMLETLREYALEQLAASGEEEETRDRHARYYLQLLQSEDDPFEGVGLVPWVARVAAEYNNMREALDWLLDSSKRLGGEREIERIMLGAQMCTDLYPFWDVQIYLREAQSWYTVAAERITSLVEATGYREQGKSAIDAARDLSPALPMSWATMFTGAGITYYYQSDYEQARIWNEKGLALRRAIGDKDGVAACVSNLGNLLADMGDYAAARHYLSESLALAHELGAPRKIAVSLSNLAIVETSLGDLDRARALLEESLDVSRGMHDVQRQAEALSILGSVARLQGKHAESIVQLNEALDLFRRFDHRGGIAEALIRLGFTACDTEDYTEAHSNFARALPILTELQNKRLFSDCLTGLALVWSHTGQPEKAARLFSSAQHLREAAGAALPPHERSSFERYLQSARSLMDESSWNVAWSEGRAMTMEESMRYAQECDESVHRGEFRLTI